jgi:hypothetical protein
MSSIIRVGLDVSKGQEKRIVLSYRLLQNYLIKMGFSISMLTDPSLKLRTMKEFDLILTLTPYGQKYKPHEIKAYLEYINLGGSVLFVTNGGGDDAARSNLNSILRHFNIQIETQRLLDPVENFHGDPTIIKTLSTNNYPNPINVDEFFMKDSTSIVTMPENSLLTTSENITSGSKTVAVKSSESEKGKLIVIGSETVFGDTEIGLKLPNHQILFETYVSWLCSISDPVKPKSEVAIPIANTQAENTNRISNFETDDDTFIEEATEKIISEFLENVEFDSESNDADRSVFNVEDSVIQMLRAFLSRALKEAQELREQSNENYVNVNLENMDQLVMIFYNLSKSVENMNSSIDSLKETLGSKLDKLIDKLEK